MKPADNILALLPRETVRACAVAFVFCVLGSGLPQSAPAQIAAGYPDDAGIRNHPSVIYATSFEQTNWLAADFPLNTEIIYWGGTDPVGRPHWSGTEAHTGRGSLSYRQAAGSNKPHPVTIQGFPGVNEIYMRWYRKYQAGYAWGCHSVKNNGVYAVANSGITEACIQPTGYDKYSFRVQDEQRSGTAEFFGALYSYHPHADNGGCGEWMSQNQGIRYQQSGKWYCYEIYMKANTVGQANGVLKLWIDSQLRGHVQGFEFRYTDQLKINQVSLYGSTGGCTTPTTQMVWDDDLVVAREYIGPMVTGPATPPPAPTNLQIEPVE